MLYIVIANKIYPDFGVNIRSKMQHFIQLFNSLPSALIKDSKSLFTNLTTNNENFQAIICKRFPKFNTATTSTPNRSNHYSGDYKALKLLLVAWVNVFSQQDVSIIASILWQIIIINEMDLTYFTFNFISICIKNIVRNYEKPDCQKWIAFLYLKVPSIMKSLMESHENMEAEARGNINNAKFSQKPLVQALILQSNLFNNQQEASNSSGFNQINYGYSVFQLFMRELLNQSALTKDEFDVFEAINLNKDDRLNNLATANENNHGTSSPHYILKVNSTLDNLINTLDFDVTKNSDSLTQILSHIIIKTNLDAILLAACHTQKLNLIYRKLVGFIEARKEASAEGGKASNSRALQYDMAFLILTYLIQQYDDHQFFTVNKEDEESTSTRNEKSSNKPFYFNWSSAFLPIPRCDEASQFSRSNSLNYQEPFHLKDKNKVEAYLSMFLSPTFEFKTTLVKWQDLTIQIPYVFYELFLAFNEGVISKDILLSILDKIRLKVCSLLFTIYVWNRFYLSTVDNELFGKVKPFLDSYFASFIKVNTNTDLGGLVNSSGNLFIDLAVSPTTVSSSYNTLDASLKDSLQDRWNLLQQIISNTEKCFTNEKMGFDVMNGSKDTQKMEIDRNAEVISEHQQPQVNYVDIFRWENLIIKLKPFEIPEFVHYNLKRILQSVETQAKCMYDGHHSRKIASPMIMEDGNSHGKFVQYFLNKKESITGLCHLDLPVSSVLLIGNYITWLNQKHMLAFLNTSTHLGRLINSIVLEIIVSTQCYLQSSASLSNEAPLTCSTKLKIRMIHYFDKLDFPYPVFDDHEAFQPMDYMIENLFTNFIKSMDLSLDIPKENFESYLITDFLNNLARHAIDEERGSKFCLSFAQKCPSQLLFKLIDKVSPDQLSIETTLTLNDMNTIEGLIKTLPIIHFYYTKF